MPLHPTLFDIALRLALTLVAGVVIGLNREERGHAAGLRTTMLVCLAASVAMIQTNLLLPVAGRTADAFSVMDVMRLPLGILSGMGFIGAGAILRRGDLISGVTTAATLWLVTVIGLCFGGGQLWLGAVTTLLAWVILYALKHFDRHMRREHKALLVLHTDLGSAPEPAINAILAEAGIASSFTDGRYDQASGTAERCYEIRWRARYGGNEPRAIVDQLLALPAVRQIDWRGTSG